MMATAAKVTVAEVEHLVPAGEIDPDHIHTPGIFVNRLVEVGSARKHIEFRNTRPRPAA
jgi:3-oxoacid CoA-transferase subunit A